MRVAYYAHTPTKQTAVSVLAVLFVAGAAEGKLMRGVRDMNTDVELDPWRQEAHDADLRLLQSSMPDVSGVSKGDTSFNDTDSEDEKPAASCPAGMLQPPVAGIMPGTNGRANIILAVGSGEPPFTELGSANDGFPLAGFVVNVGLALKDACNNTIDIQFSQAPSGTCFTSFGIGDRLVEGAIHGCANYLKTPGKRDRQAEFTLPIADNRLPSGLLVKLDADGNPMLNGMDSLEGKIIVDVPGTVPNPEEYDQAINTCTGEKFAPLTSMSNGNGMVTSNLPGTLNDAALRYLLAGNADALWINARTPESLSCKNVPKGTTPSYDCTLWDGLGTTFAFVQTGIPSTALTGVTLAMSKKGSGLSQILNPCIEQFLQTKAYYEICQTSGLAQNGICFPNEFFPVTIQGPVPEWAQSTENLSTEDCSTGYCPCTAKVSNGGEEEIPAAPPVTLVTFPPVPSPTEDVASPPPDNDSDIDDDDDGTGVDESECSLVQQVACYFRPEYCCS